MNIKGICNTLINNGISSFKQSINNNMYQQLTNSSITNQNIADNFTTINSAQLEKIRFKTYNPTYFWNSNDDFGSDIDTVFIVSKNGVSVNNYYEITNLSGIIFEYDSRYFGSHDSVKKRINELYGISNLQIKDFENNILSRHIKGETNEFYLEIYCIKHNDVYYAIELNVYKNNYTKNELNFIISEYHTIINTLEIL